MRFKEEFYNHRCDRPQSGRPKSWTDGEASKFRFLKKEQSEYDGPVYNLEVEEDHSYSLLNATVHNCFATDSNGFFPRSLIEKCVVGRPNAPDVEHPSCGRVRFQARLRGERRAGRYVIAVDPASERGQLRRRRPGGAGPEHRRIVHCWTTTRNSGFKVQASSKGLAQEAGLLPLRRPKDPPAQEGLPPLPASPSTSQGGGVAVLEALGRRGPPPGRASRPMLPRPSSRKNWKPTDDMPGEHIIEIVAVRPRRLGRRGQPRYEEGLRGPKALLFPEFDAAHPGRLAMPRRTDKAARPVKGTNRRLGREALRHPRRLHARNRGAQGRARHHRPHPDRHVPPGPVGHARDSSCPGQEGASPQGPLLRPAHGQHGRPDLLARAPRPSGPTRACGGFASQLARGGGRPDAAGPLYVGPDWFAAGVNAMGGGYGAVGRR
jgi:hypothetical protein